jgi:hypothetical protein
VSALTTSAALPLGEWQNFYVLVGSAAGALIGLTFIVITVAAGASGIPNAAARLAGLRAFITPTAVYFGYALAVSAVMSVPGQTAFSLTICLAVGAAGGLLYWGSVIRWMLRASSGYRLFLADWIWSVILPPLAYVSLAASAGLLAGHTAAALYIVAAMTLLLLFVGIHNAWDVVVWMTTERDAHRERGRAYHASEESSSSRGPESR